MKTFFCIICLLAAVPVAESGGNDVKKLTKASNDFSQRLYQETALNEPNSIYSPRSIHEALSMTSLGARGDTATELSRVLGLNDFGQGAANPHEVYSEVIKKLNSATYVKILSANALYVNPSIQIEEKFIDDVTNYYHAKVSNIDLNAPGGPEAPINAYVENSTEGLIKDLLKPGDIDDNTVMFLVNTLFFNGTWVEKFKKYNTRQSTFQTPSGNISVNTMFDDRSINIKRNFNGADIGELAFRGGEFSLFIVLPHDVNGLPEQERSLTTPGRIVNLFEGLRPTYVKISLPKVKIESTFELKTPLKALGIVKAFDSRKANLTGISSGGGVYIDKVIHKAVIEVTETGTVAAAATGLQFMPVSGHVGPGPRETFYVDRPYLVFLRDNKLNLILFQGKHTGN